MERQSVLAGYVLVMLAAMGGWALAMTPPSPGSPWALMVVMVGAAGYLLACHPSGELQAARQPVTVADPAAVRERLLHLARIARLAGGRGLERELGDLAAEPLGKAGLRLVSDRATPAEVDQALEPLAQRLEQAARLPGEVWSTVARGTLHAGALLSLVQMSWALSALPPEQSTDAVAASLSGTIYGLAIAWLIAQPRIVQARRTTRRVAQVNHLWLTGWRAIAEGVHPLRLADRLTTERAA